MSRTGNALAAIVMALAPSAALAQAPTAYVLRYGYFTPFESELAAVEVVTPDPAWDPVDAVTVGPLGIGAVWEMTMSPSGQLIGLHSYESQLVHIDMETGAATPLVDLDIEVSYNQDDSIAFDSGGRLWLASHTKLYQVDLQTGATTLITELEEYVSQIAVHQGRIYAAGFSKFVEVDPLTGSFTVLENWNGNESGCSLDGLYSDGSTLWGIRGCWSGAGGGGGPSPNDIVSFFPFETHLSIDISPHGLEGEPFAIVVPRAADQQMPALPVLHPIATITFATIILAVGVLSIRSRL